MKIPQFSPWISKEEYQEIASCFKSNWFTEGSKAKLFTKKLLKLIGAKYGVFAPNGTLALYLGLKALGIGEGDEVIVPDFTFIGSATAIEMVGAKYVFVDVNRNNFQIDLEKANKLVRSSTKAIMPVHMYGTVCDMDKVIKFAKVNHLKIIEDAAEAIGVKWNGVHAGVFGDIGCFSFFADKTITTAEGGFIVTNDEKIYTNLLYLRNQGRIERGSFIHPKIGYNFRITDIQAAIGIVQLKKLKKIIRRKIQILKKYKKLLKDIPQITFFKPDKGADWIPFRVGILYDGDAHKLMDFMKKNGIETRTFFYPLHKQPCFSNNLQKDSDFPNSIYGYEHGICLPTFPALKDKQIEFICKNIKKFINAKR